MLLGLWIWSSIQQTYVHVWGYLKLSVMGLVLSWARSSHGSNPAISIAVSTLMLTPLHCRNQLEQKCLHFVTLYMNNGTRQHINPRYKTQLVAHIQSFLCQQMETFNNPPFRTSPVDADCYILRQDHAQAEHVRAMQHWSAKLHLTYSDSSLSCKATSNPTWTKTTTKL